MSVVKGHRKMRYLSRGQCGRLPSFRDLCKSANIVHEPSVRLEIMSLLVDEISHKGHESQPQRVPATEHQTLSLDDYVPIITIDKNNHYDPWLKEALEGKTLSEWMRLQSTRSPSRSLYGSNTKFEDTPINRDSKSPEHTYKEKHRRIRQSSMMTTIDTLCSDFHFRLADYRMPDEKRYHGQSLPKNKRRAEKTVGKDELLLGTIFALRMQQWIRDALFAFMSQRLGFTAATSINKASHSNDHHQNDAKGLFPPSPPASSFASLSDSE